MPALLPTVLAVTATLMLTPREVVYRLAGDLGWSYQILDTCSNPTTALRERQEASSPYRYLTSITYDVEGTPERIRRWLELRAKEHHLSAANDWDTLGVLAHRNYESNTTPGMLYQIAMTARSKTNSAVCVNLYVRR